MTPGEPFCVDDIISFLDRRQLAQRAALWLFVFFATGYLIACMKIKITKFPVNSLEDLIVGPQYQTGISSCTSLFNTFRVKYLINKILHIYEKQGRVK